MVVFEKTPKGQEEIKNKTHGLSMIERRVLIFIDGKRTFDDLKSLPRVTDLDSILGLLNTQGYIARMTTAKKTTSKAPARQREIHSSASLESSGELNSPFRELPATFDPDKFNMAKHFMINTLNHFKGFYGGTRLVRKVDGCQTHEELRELYEAWCKAIDGTRAGKKQGKKLRKDLLAVL